MIPVAFFEDKTIFILGLGRTGNAVAQAALLSGARVLAWDDAPEARAQAEGVCLTDPHSFRNWDQIAAVILSPGVAHTRQKPHLVCTAADAQGVPIYTDIDLYFQACPQARVVGITGTNGKSTTTALVTHILKGAGKGAQMGGNIGTPVLNLEVPEPGGITVLELSSYQLDSSHPGGYDVAILLNVSPDHLQRHGTMGHYIAAKERIFQNQSMGQLSIVGRDDPGGEGVFAHLSQESLSKVIGISGRRVLSQGVSVVDRILYDRAFGTQMQLDLRGVPRIHTHHGQNVAAAYIACRYFGINPEFFVKTLGSFMHLSHRQEEVAIIEGVSYINDSKATNCEAAQQALQSADHIFWILGGRPKAQSSIKALVPYLSGVRHAFVIGEARSAYGQDLAAHVPVTLCADLGAAVAQAHSLADPQSVVLFSPACESFDLYRNFEERGDHFKSLVGALPGSRDNMKEGDI